MSPSDYTPTDIAKTGQGRFDSAAASLRDRAELVRDRLGELADEARNYADRASDQLTTYSRSAIERAREKPATSALVVLGVGIAVGAILALALRKPVGGLADSALDGASRLRRKLHS